MNRKRRLFLLCLVLPLALCVLGAWRVYPGLHQRWLDNQLLAAIYRDDLSAVTGLLARGATPNAQGNEATARQSLWQFLRSRWSGQRINATRSALDAAFFTYIPQTEAPNGQIITTLLEHGATLVTPVRANVRVYEDHFHHGSQEPYVSFGWIESGERGTGEDAVTVYPMTEEQADALIRAALKAGAHSL